MTALATTWTIAAVTLRRLVRGRALWVSVAIAVLPVGFAYLLHARGRSEHGVLVDVLAFEQLVLAVLPALFIASSIGEEIEDRTTTYLWSRPIPRWSIVAGKLVALAPIICALSLASWSAAVLAGVGTLPELRSDVALALGAIALSMIAATLGVLVPRYAMAVTICYMLFLDLPLGAMPASIRNLSVTYHVRVIADVLGKATETASHSVIAIAVIAAIWTVVGVLRVRRLEA
ncbi:MAG TPA: ABC transporter permease [Kofleriaceae bacterium]|nr:ABC transporter permease [Kofleriaceae bacterium]